MYGEDRLQTPLLRKRDGAYAKDGEFTPVSLGRGVRRDGRPVQEGPEGKRGQRLSACSGSVQWTIFEGYAATKLCGRVSAPTILIPMHAIAWHQQPTPLCAPSAWTTQWDATTISRMRDAFVLWGSNMAEMHPILWTRVARIADLGSRRYASRFLSRRSRKSKHGPRRHSDRLQARTDLAIPEQHSQPHHHPDRACQRKPFVDDSLKIARGVTDIGYGLRPDNPMEV